MATANALTWEQYQALPPEQRRRLLTDPEYAALTQQQLEAAGLADPTESAPADFGGRVLPNPSHIAPAWDTDPTIPVTRLPVGVTFHKDGWQGEAPGDISNPAAADIFPIAGREISAQMADPQLKLPPGATLESGSPPPAKLPPGATLESGSPPPAKADAPGWLDREIPLAEFDANGNQKPESYLNPTLSGVQSIARGFVGLGKGTYELLKPPSWEEIEDAMQGVTDPTLMPAAILAKRSGKNLTETAKQATQVPAAVRDINTSPDPLGHYAKAAQDTAGQGAAQAITAVALEGAPKIASAGADALAKVAKTARGAVSTAGKVATGVGTALDPDLVGMVSPRAAHALRTAQKLGTIATKVGGAAEPAEALDATAENKPFAGGMDEPPAARPARELDATGENKPFAGGMDEYVPKLPAAAPPTTAAETAAEAVPAPAPARAPAAKPIAAPAPAPATPAAANTSSAAAESAPTVAEENTPTPKRSIVKDPETGESEFSDVIKRREEIRSKLGDLADKIQAQEKAAASATKKPATITSAARVPETDEDLTNLLQQSLDQIKAAKGGVYTTAAPGDLLKRWGVTDQSIADTDANLRGMSPAKSQAYRDALTDSYKKGSPVEPVMETRDADNNIVEVDGRHRALAAQKAGIERIPVIVRRIAAPAMQQ